MSIRSGWRHCCSAAAGATLLLVLLASSEPSWRAEGAPGDDEVDSRLSVPQDAFTNGVGMRLVRVKAGTFTMGSPKGEEDRDGEQERQHEVEITRDFFVGATEVTQRQYEAVTGRNPSTFSKGGDYARKVKGMDTSDFPVEEVSWEDARKFCEKLTAREALARPRLRYRLPSEAEWEYACRGGHKAKEQFGSAAMRLPFHFATPSASLGDGQANFQCKWPYGGGKAGVSLGRPCKVGSYEPNALGLFDMHGNVEEWCADWWAKDAYGAKGRGKDPRGPDTGRLRVVRGGNYRLFGHHCRAARRGCGEPARSDCARGFRVVCDAPGTAPSLNYGKEARALAFKKGKGEALAEHPDGKTRVAGDQLKGPKGQVLADLAKGRFETVASHSFSRDGKLLAVGFRYDSVGNSRPKEGTIRGYLRVYDARTGALLGDARLDLVGPVEHVAFSKEGDAVLYRSGKYEEHGGK